MLPNVNIHPQDGALGLPSGFPSGAFASVGACSTGARNSPIVVTDADQVASLLGTGRLADAVKGALASGARMVIAIRTAAEADGIVGDIAKTATPHILNQGPNKTGSGMCLVSGIPTQSGRFNLRIVVGGELGTATFKWRIADGEWSDPIATGASVALGSTGLTAAFANGGQQPSFVAEDQFNADLFGGGDGTLAVVGTPTGDHDVEVLVTWPGGFNEGKYRYRKDGGDYSAEQTIQSANFLVPGTGVSLDFAEGTGMSFEAGDEYSFSTTGPKTSVQAYSDGIKAVAKSALQVEWIHVVGPTDSAAWVAFDALAESEFAAKFRFLHLVCETRAPGENETIDAWVAALVDEADGVSLRRTNVVASQVIADGVLQNAAARYCGRLSTLRVHQSAGRVIDGPIAGVTALGPLDTDGIEQVNDGHIELLDAAHYTTFRRHIGIGGVYVTNARMMVADTSDYRWVEYRRTMDKACREVRVAGLRSEHREATASGLEALKGDLRQPLAVMRGAGEIVAARVDIPDGQDVIATSTVRVKVGIQPAPAMRFIEVDIGFENPFRA